MFQTITCDAELQIGPIIIDKVIHPGRSRGHYLQMKSWFRRDDMFKENSITKIIIKFVTIVKNGYVSSNYSEKIRKIL